MIGPPTINRLASIAAAFALAVCPFAVAVAAEEWRFVLPEPEGAHEHPPLRAIPLSPVKPDDLKERAAYRGAARRYAQIRYGSPAAARVAIVVDQVSSAEADLYVDRNRNRAIEPNERVQGERSSWRVPLDVEYVNGDITTRKRRALAFRLGAGGRLLSFAAAGYLEGRIALADGGASRMATVRRVDGDGNGFFTDPRDRLWIDLNGDGQWDPLTEQFPFATVASIEGTRYAVRSDEQGNRLALAKLEGTGTIKLAVRDLASQTSREPGLLGNVVALAVTMSAPDGSVVGLRGIEEQTTVPVGEYRVTSVAITLDDWLGGPRWNFVFSDRFGHSTKRYEVTKGSTITVDPLGRLEFLTGVAKTSVRPGAALLVQPRLLTGDGLLINTCYRGLSETGSGGGLATITLGTPEGEALETGQSGFA